MSRPPYPLHTPFSCVSCISWFHAGAPSVVMTRLPRSRASAMTRPKLSERVVRTRTSHQSHTFSSSSPKAEETIFSRVERLETCRGLRWILDFVHQSCTVNFIQKGLTLFYQRTDYRRRQDPAIATGAALIFSIISAIRFVFVLSTSSAFSAYDIFPGRKFTFSEIIYYKFYITLTIPV